MSGYEEEALACATGVELVLALYDGWIRFLQRATAAIEQGDVIQRRYSVKRGLDIVMHLQSRLRMDIGGMPAVALSDFYAAMFAMMLEASSAESAEQMLQVIACVRNVRDAWAVVARDPAAGRVPSPEPHHTPVPMSHPIGAGGKQESAGQRWSA